MTLEHYPAMAQAELERIEAEARERWPHVRRLFIRPMQGAAEQRKKLKRAF
jgi:molybdopterin synthase catalytic subunit